MTPYVSPPLPGWSVYAVMDGPALRRFPWSPRVPVCVLRVPGADQYRVLVLSREGWLRGAIYPLVGPWRRARFARWEARGGESDSLLTLRALAALRARFGDAGVVLLARAGDLDPAIHPALDAL